MRCSGPSRRTFGQVWATAPEPTPGVADYLRLGVGETVVRVGEGERVVDDSPDFGGYSTVAGVANGPFVTVLAS